MNSRLVVSAVTAVALALGSVSAIAQPRGEQRGHAQNQHRDAGKNQHRGPGKTQSRAPHHSNAHAQPRHKPHDRHVDRRGPPRHAHAGRGAGPRHNFYRGDRMPAQYRGHQYVVNNWRVHHLNPPPRGYYWVQTGADYALIAIASGIIAQIVLGH